jgi:hypothetical protein
MLVPPAQLICWSHGASENPQSSQDNGENDSQAADPHFDAIMSTATSSSRNQTGDTSDHSSSPQRKTN